LILNCNGSVSSAVMISDPGVGPVEVEQYSILYWRPFVQKWFYNKKNKKLCSFRNKWHKNASTEKSNAFLFCFGYHWFRFPNLQKFYNFIVKKAIPLNKGPSVTNSVLFDRHPKSSTTNTISSFITASQDHEPWPSPQGISCEQIISSQVCISIYETFSDAFKTNTIENVANRCHSIERLLTNTEQFTQVWFTHFLVYIWQSSKFNRQHLHL
jgi:hypothetical protein